MVSRTVQYYAYQHAIHHELGDVDLLRRKHKRLTQVFAREILIYLLASCLGEARHAPSRYVFTHPINPDEFDKDDLNTFGEAVAYQSANMVMGREPSWPAVRPLMKIIGEEEMLLGLSQIFNKFDWKHNGGSGYGGAKWGQLADAGLMFVRGEITPGIFIDTIVSMVHNGGWAFNKWYTDRPECCSRHRNVALKGLLDIKATDAARLWDNICLPKHLTGIKPTTTTTPATQTANKLWQKLIAAREGRTA